jgi:threonyl-tRNA synthetase
MKHLLNNGNRMNEFYIVVGSKKFILEKGNTLFDLIKKSMPGAKFTIVAAKSSDGIIELNSVVDRNMEIEWISSDSPDGLRILRHSASHIMAQAVVKLYPDTKVAIGPATDDGFYYDFESKSRFNDGDFAGIEVEMQKIIDADYPFVRTTVKKQDAIDRFKGLGEKFKVELIQGITDETVSFYTDGDFVDLCKGPHVPSTGFIKAYKLMKIAGAYWRGDEKNAMLQRIYGTAFADSKSLKSYLNMIEEAKERDHRKIGKEMNLFGFYPEGPGFPFWKPNGMVLYNTVVNYWKKIHLEEGYLEVKTPIILNEDLWHRSGHWDNYNENMYFTKIDGQSYAVKPMNCPGGLLIFKDGIHSYRELPMKVAELGLVHRHEKSGVLHGLFRVRQFTQDDAHIYCTKDQVKDEIKKVIRLIKRIYNDFGFTDVNLELSTRPVKSIGSDEAWAMAEKALSDSLVELGIEYKLNPGDGAFYGPKIDFHIKDAIGRSWQCGTIQCDFSLPERFEISYVGQDGLKHQPVMLHRTVFGSLERFIGIIIENFKGKFPFWLSPEQIRILPIAKSHFEFAEETKKILQKFNFRVNIDDSEEKLGSRIKRARLERVGYVCIIGDNEMSKRTVTVRKSDKEENKEIAFEKIVDFFSELENNLR